MKAALSYFEKALEYVNSGQYRWNAGMFIWSFVTITEGLQKHQPEMYDACQRWFKVAASLLTNSFTFCDWLLCASKVASSV